MSLPKHWLRLGGQDAVVRLVDAFYEAMDTRPEAATIRAMHDADLTEAKAVLVRFISEWLRAPGPFSPERGAAALRRRHQRFAVDDAARDAWMFCMHHALAQVCPDDGLRTELEAAFRTVADLMRNAGPHTRAERTNTP